jgi:hypothetical protein
MNAIVTERHLKGLYSDNGIAKEIKPFVKPRGSKKPKGALDPTRSNFIDSFMLLDVARGAMKAATLFTRLNNLKSLSLLRKSSI